jgi:hypothetical protein
MQQEGCSRKEMAEPLKDVPSELTALYGTRDWGFNSNNFVGSVGKGADFCFLYV